MNRIKWDYLFPIATIVLVGLFMWAIHDRFFPIQEEWMQYYSLLMQKGLLPYRDFYFYTQPISLFMAQFIQNFGEDYILFRYYGMAERALLILALYYLIARHFSPTATFIAVVTSAFLYLSFNLDVFYSFYQTTLLFFFVSLICLQRAPEARHPWLYHGLAGVFASLAFFTKQSSGSVVSIFLLGMMVWYAPASSWFLRISSYLLGWAVPAAFIGRWLVSNNIYDDYIGQVFGGISAKGSPLDILFGFWGRNFAVFYLVLFLLSLLALYTLWKKKRFWINHEAQPAERLSQFNGLLLVYYPVFLISGFLLKTPAFVLDQYHFLWLYFTFYTLTICILIIGIKWITGKQIPFSIPLAQLILASFVWTYSVGLSGQLELKGTLLGTALVLAYLLDRIQISWKHFKFFLITASCLVIFICSAKKSHMLYAWWGWTEYGHQENTTSVIPALKGFKLSPETVHVYDQIYQYIIENTTSGDYVYTFPFMTLFNYATDRRQPTFAPIEYFDVCPDNIAVMDAGILLNNPPKMIIYMIIPELAYKFHEDVFRNGQVSGQRSLDAAIVEIVKKYDYRLIHIFLSQGWNWPIFVYVRP